MMGQRDRGIEGQMTDIRVVEAQASVTETSPDFLTYQVNDFLPGRRENPSGSWPRRTGSQHPLLRLTCICGQKCSKATSGDTDGSTRVTASHDLRDFPIVHVA